MKTSDETMTTIDPATLETVQGCWGPMLVGAGIGIGAGAFYLGHSKGTQKRDKGEGQPIDSIKDVVDPRNPYNAWNSVPGVGPLRYLYKAGEYVGRT